MAVARNARPKEKLRLLRLEDKLAVPPDRAAGDRPQ